MGLVSEEAEGKQSTEEEPEAQSGGLASLRRWEWGLNMDLLDQRVFWSMSPPYPSLFFLLV